MLALKAQSILELDYFVNYFLKTPILRLSFLAKQFVDALNIALFFIVFSVTNNIMFTPGVTSMFYSAIGTSSSTNRKKRRTKTSATNPQYIVFKSEGTKPINIQFTAATSTTRAVNSFLLCRYFQTQKSMRLCMIQSVMKPALGVDLCIMNSADKQETFRYEVFFRSQEPKNNALCYFPSCH